MMLPTTVAALAMLHSFGARVMDCPPAGSVPGLTTVARPSEVFRTVPLPDGSVALSLRQERRLALWRPGAAALEPLGAADAFGRGGSLPGLPEELVLRGSTGGLFASMVPGGGIGTPRPASAFNQLLTVGPPPHRERAFEWIPAGCWVNTMTWRDDDQQLWIGCEDKAGLVVWAPGGDEPTKKLLDPALGDVQRLAFDDRGAQLWTISLWRRPTISRLRQDPLELEAQAVIGGTHFDLVRDHATGLLFASAYYASRVRVIDGSSLEVVDTLPTGLGTRALAIDPERRLLLASSVYDGRLRVWSLDDRRLIASLPVGGHVKSIGLIPDSGTAVFWSQCGLQTLDLTVAAGVPSQPLKPTAARAHR
jgi:hypothetical protein